MRCARGRPAGFRGAVRLGLVLLALPAFLTAGPDARKIYEKSCAPCHGKTGTPNALMAKKGTRDFSDKEWQKSRTDDQLVKSIREGVPKTKMASFEDALSPAEIGALVQFIRKLGQAK